MDDVTKLNYLNNQAQSKTLDAQKKSACYIDKYWEAKTEVNDKIRSITHLQELVEELEEQVGNLQVEVNNEANRAESYLVELNHYHENDDDGLFENDDEEVHFVGAEELADTVDMNEEEEIDDGIFYI